MPARHQPSFRAAPEFADFINFLPPGDTIVAAHSLGNLLVSAAIEDHGAHVDRFFMLNAAVAAYALDSGHPGNLNNEREGRQRGLGVHRRAVA